MGLGAAGVNLETERDGDRARLVPAGSFDLSHAATMRGVLERVQPAVDGCQSVELDLAKLARLDGTGAVLLARLLDRLEAMGHRTQVVDVGNRQAGRLIALYRERRSDRPPAHRRVSALAQLGGLVSQVPRTAGAVLDFLGRFAAAVPKVIAAPRSMNWGSLPALMQEVGADSFVVTGAANLLVGVIIAFLGISQLGRFGAVSFVPELVIVAQFRELGPLVTAIVVAGRSGAGFASEIATMKVSEEVDALRSMGFDPMRWLVLPRCLALVVAVPLLTWIGDALAVFGGFLATTAITSIRHRRGDHGHAFLHRPDQDAVSGAGHRLDRLRSRADRDGGRRRRRRQDNRRGGAVDLQRHRDQFAVHLLLRLHGNLRCPRHLPRRRRTSPSRISASAGARGC